uniref:Uncharacterized protein n=1 Tax=Sarcoptes scabiei TaxID=52283 RepID=A0A834RGF1_SARSC
MNFHKKSFNHPIIIDSNVIQFVNNIKIKNVIKGLIRPIMTYGFEIWSDQINKKQKNNFESLQHQFLENSIMGFKTISKTCAQSLKKTVLLQTHIDIKGMKFFHNNHIQRIDTNDLNANIQDFKRTKLMENFALTNQNFQSFFVHNFIPKFVLTNFYTTQFFHRTWPVCRIPA